MKSKSLVRMYLDISIELGINLEKVIYNKLSSNDLKIISIFLTEDDNKLKCNILVSDDVER